MTTITEAVETTLARRDADELAALREEYRRELLDSNRREETLRARVAELEAALEGHASIVVEARADLATAAEVTARLTEERDALHANELRLAALAEEFRVENVALRAQRDALHDCGQDACALAPGCIRHFAERGNELRAQRDAAVEALVEALKSTRCRNQECNHSWHRKGREALALTKGGMR